MLHALGKHLIVATTALLVSTMAQADERYDPIKDKVVAEECGDCHMAFQPQMLPKKSWAKIMTGLSEHFGEDASVDAPTQKRIEKYLISNAADSGWRDGKFMRGLAKGAAPLRITETPHWVREHNHEVPEGAWKDAKVKTKANCLACHRRANKGDYDDD